jgi:hypothetical protein
MPAKTCEFCGEALHKCGHREPDRCQDSSCDTPPSVVVWWKVGKGVKFRFRTGSCLSPLGTKDFAYLCRAHATEVIVSDDHPSGHRVLDAKRTKPADETPRFFESMGT